MLFVEPTRIIEGSKKVFETKKSPEVEKEVKGDGSSYLGLGVYDIEQFFSEYNSLSVSAINTGDFSVVSYMVKADGPRYKEQSDFIESLYAKGVTEEHLGTTVEKVKVVNDHLLQVTTIEKFVIHGTEKSSEKKYRTVTLMYVNDGNWYMQELISTNEI